MGSNSHMVSRAGLLLPSRKQNDALQYTNSWNHWCCLWDVPTKREKYYKNCKLHLNLKLYQAFHLSLSAIVTLSVVFFCVILNNNITKRGSCSEQNFQSSSDQQCILHNIWQSIVLTPVTCFSHLMLAMSCRCSSVVSMSGRTEANHSTLFSAAYCFSTLNSFSFTSGSSPRICSTWWRLERTVKKGQSSLRLSQ